MKYTIKLSAYTIAANCTDLTDCCDGLIEIWNVINHRRRAGKKIFVYQGKRLRDLRGKLIKFVSSQTSFDEYELAKLEEVDTFYHTACAKLSEIAINKNAKRGLPINPNIEIDRSHMSTIKKYLL